MAKLWRRSRGEAAVEETTPLATEGEPDDVEPSEVDADPVDVDAVEPDGAPEPHEADEPQDEPQTEDEADEPAYDGGADAEEPVVDEGGAEPDIADDDPPKDDLDIDDNPVVEKPKRGLRGSLVLSLLQAAHLKQAVGTALVIGGVAAVAGRSAREVGVIILTVLTGQVMLGWHNDVTDRERDKRHETPGKPVADGRLDPGTVWYAIVVAVLILVPLSVTTGVTAGCLYLMSVAVGFLGNVTFRTGILSWWSWAVSFGMLPYYLSYGGWGGKALGTAPEPVIVVLAALLGVGLHFMRSVWGLVADHEDGWTYLPLKIALKLGATRLLALSTAYTVVIVVLLLIFGAKVGLSR